MTMSRQLAVHSGLLLNNLSGAGRHYPPISVAAACGTLYFEEPPPTGVKNMKKLFASKKENLPFGQGTEITVNS